MNIERIEYANKVCSECEKTVACNRKPYMLVLMTTKQIDRLIGKTVRITFPAYNETYTLTLVRREGRRVYATDLNGHEGVYMISDMELAVC